MKQSELRAEKIENKVSAECNEIIAKFYELLLFSFDEINTPQYAKLASMLVKRLSKCMFDIVDYVYERELYEAQRRTEMKYYSIDDEYLYGMIEDMNIRNVVLKDIKEWKEQLEYIVKSGKINRIPKKEIEDMMMARTGKNGECGITYKIMRILRTEGNRMVNKASVIAYNDADVKQYMYHAILDNKVCEECQRLDGTIFNVKDAKQGLNLPPLHPNCRCYITPLGYPYTDISFDEWQKQYLK